MILDPNYVEIGNPDLIRERRPRPVPCPPGGMLSNYVPFYFTPFTPMLLNIKTGYNGIRKRGNDEIIILVTSLPILEKSGVPFLFTDRHAYLAHAQFYSDRARLDQVDWRILQARDFSRDPDDPGKFERYQAEALVHKHLPIGALRGIVCHNESVAVGLREDLAKRGLKIEIVTRPTWYFQ